MPFSTHCHTPLSNFEAGQNYKDVQDPAGGRGKWAESISLYIDVVIFSYCEFSS